MKRKKHDYDRTAGWGLLSGRRRRMKKSASRPSGEVDEEGEASCKEKGKGMTWK
jgi:hypothetical protein